MLQAVTSIPQRHCGYAVAAAYSANRRFDPLSRRLRYRCVCAVQRYSCTVRTVRTMARTERRTKRPSSALRACGNAAAVRTLSRARSVCCESVTHQCSLRRCGPQQCGVKPKLFTVWSDAEGIASKLVGQASRSRQARPRSKSLRWSVHTGGMAGAL
jgi:hypothetical protein